MLLLGHAAVSARRGPRGTCQETRAALWAPAECGVTARSASDGVDVNGIRVHHRRLQYRRYQCGVCTHVRRKTANYAISGRSFIGEYGIHGLVQQIRIYIKENIDETVSMFALFKCRKPDKGRN